MVSTWDRSSTGVDGFALARRLDGLTDVPEASGPTVRWRVSDNVAVKEFQSWTSQAPRHWRAVIWRGGETGRLQVEAAAVCATEQPHVR
ncbi:hypothetical protein GCM10009665_00840 [Kitasatospora nipponensis]|uniref:Uncharacterized protein n=1 Tax=Kitasatospora nipponensis TaxID=258049 RepID=A0ABP4G5S5_9ACTN